jgi:hypothetical protein
MEALLLVVSSKLSTLIVKAIVEIYSDKMQTEQTFRDIKIIGGERDCRIVKQRCQIVWRVYS